MKTNKRLIAGALVALGFGGVVGLASGCGAGRVSKSRTADDAPAVDSVIMPGRERPVQVMYGPPPARFDRSRPIQEIILDNPVK
jgi:hypothetical protein